MVTKNLEISYLLDFYGDVLTEKQRDVMEQYYNDDLSLSEIADNFGITRQGIESLEQLARDINFYNNNNYAMSEDIHRAADEMLHIINRMSEA